MVQMPIGSLNSAATLSATARTRIAATFWPWKGTCCENSSISLPDHPSICSPWTAPIAVAFVLFRTKPFSVPLKYKIGLLSLFCPTSSKTTLLIATLIVRLFRSAAFRNLLGNASFTVVITLFLFGVVG